MTNLPQSVLEVKVSPYPVMLPFISHSWIVIGTGTSPLEDEGAWRILFQYLTTEMTYPQMEEDFISYLGDRYCMDDWKDARDALFSAEDLNDNATPLANLQVLYTKHVPQASLLNRVGPPEDSWVIVSAPRTLGRLSDTRKSHPSRQSRQRPKVSENCSFGEHILIKCSRRIPSSTPKQMRAQATMRRRRRRKGERRAVALRFGHRRSRACQDHQAKRLFCRQLTTSSTKLTH